METHPIEIGSKVTVGISNTDQTCVGLISNRMPDDSDGRWLYRIQVESGDRMDEHLDEFGELWVNDFEVTLRRI